MRFLHLSDLHFGRSLCEYSLLEDQRHWCRQLLAHLDGIQYDAVLIAGDLYDRAVPSAGAVELCDWFLAELAGKRSIPVLCIAGNHDSPQRLSFASSLYRAAGLYMAAIPERKLARVTLEDQWGPVDFFLLPYLTPGDGRTLFPQEEIHTFQDAYATLLRENREEIAAAPRRVLPLLRPGAPSSRTDSGDPKAAVLRQPPEILRLGGGTGEVGSVGKAG